MRVILLFIMTDIIVGEPAVIILARGGSKGLRLKNIQKVGGESLLARAVRTASRAGLRDVTVSTDHPLVAMEAIKSGAKVFHRSKVTATDWAPSIWGAAEFLATRSGVTTLVLIQATSPFIRPDHLREAYTQLEYPKTFDCVFSVTRSYKLRWRQEGSSVRPVNFKVNARPRRQDWSGELLETGAFYIARRHLIESGYFQNDNCSVVEVSSLDSMEVDTELDLQAANALFTHNLIA